MLADLVTSLTRRLADQKLLRDPRAVQWDVDGPVLRVDGRPVVCFCSNDYLGLARHPALARAVGEASAAGWGAGASRLLAGTTPPHEALESAVAAFRRRPAALAFSSGYLANLGVLAGLGTEEVTFFSDELNHASLIDGMRLSAARRHVYRHADAGHLEELLRRHADTPHRLVVTEAVFSMEGDVAPLAELAALARRFGADLVVDDAHGTGVLGPEGRGTLLELGVEAAVEVVTLSKAAGASGGAVVADAAVVRLLQSRARSFVYSTAPPPPVAAAAARAVELMLRADAPRRRLAENTAYVRARLDRPGRTPIVPVLLGSAERALAASAALWEKGFFVPAIRPPTVPEGTSRLRLSITAEHRREHLDGLLDALAAL
jgi:8-amino-7-oxononanoate synthase